MCFIVAQIAQAGKGKASRMGSRTEYGKAGAIDSGFSESTAPAANPFAGYGVKPRV